MDGGGADEGAVCGELDGDGDDGGGGDELRGVFNSWWGMGVVQGGGMAIDWGIGKAACILDGVLVGGPLGMGGWGEGG